MRIAILEDDAEQAALIRAHLSGIGHECLVYGSGKALIVDAGRESFDLFLLDWQVPDLSGEEVLRWVRIREMCVSIVREGISTARPHTAPRICPRDKSRPRF